MYTCNQGSFWWFHMPRVLKKLLKDPPGANGQTASTVSSLFAAFLGSRTAKALAELDAEPES